ncbi:MAG: ABC transporter permease [Calditrichales bacterium]|nr:MAG: ABC transporter permease [Calditrichales bacterium]
MLMNYFKITVRMLQKTKLYSFINLLGLSIGMAACLLILQYIHFEKSYDSFHSRYDQIYRLRYERIKDDGSAVRFASCTPLAGNLIRERFPEVAHLARVFRYQGVIITHDNIKFTEERVFHAEPSFVDIFDFKFISGDPRKALAGVDQALISESMAKKYFGTDDPIGKMIKVNQKTEYAVTGVFEDVPVNSHIKFDFLLSFENFAKSSGPDYMDNWGHTGMYTYLILQPGADMTAFENKIAQLVETEFGEALKYYHMEMLLLLQPLKDIHLTSHFMQEFEVNGDRDSINFLYLIATFIIIIAWVNYINLSTARALTRAKEVALRKTVGASRRQLVFQFLFETVILNIISVVIAVVILQLVMPYFVVLTGIDTTYPFWGQTWLWQALAGLFVTGIVLSGAYPVMRLSAFIPAAILRGKLGTGQKGLGLRKLLVIFQYMMAIGLLTGTLTVYYQIDHLRTRDLGFKIDNILVVKGPRIKDDHFSEKITAFKDELRNQSDVKKICVVTEVPGKQIYWDNGGIRKAGEDAGKGKNYQIVGIDYDFIDVFEVPFIAGRNFSKEHPSDDKALILNETAVSWMGFNSAGEAIDQRVDYWGEIFTIIGVIKDYHQQSPKLAFEPHIFRLMPEGRHNLGLFAISIQSENISATIDEVKSRYDRLFPSNPFDYFFLDDYFDQQYKSDLRRPCVRYFRSVGYFCHQPWNPGSGCLYGHPADKRNRNTQSFRGRYPQHPLYSHDRNY